MNVPADPSFITLTAQASVVVHAWLALTVPPSLRALIHIFEPTRP